MGPTAPTPRATRRARRRIASAALKGSLTVQEAGQGLHAPGACSSSRIHQQRRRIGCPRPRTVDERRRRLSCRHRHRRSSRDLTLGRAIARTAREGVVPTAFVCLLTSAGEMHQPRRLPPQCFNAQVRFLPQSARIIAIVQTAGTGHSAKTGSTTRAHSTARTTALVSMAAASVPLGFPEMLATTQLELALVQLLRALATAFALARASVRAMPSISARAWALSRQNLARAATAKPRQTPLGTRRPAALRCGSGAIAPALFRALLVRIVKMATAFAPRAEPALPALSQRALGNAVVVELATPTVRVAFSLLSCCAPVAVAFLGTAIASRSCVALSFSVLTCELIRVLLSRWNTYRLMHM